MDLFTQTCRSKINLSICPDCHRTFLLVFAVACGNITVSSFKNLSIYYWPTLLLQEGNNFEDDKNNFAN